MTNEEALLIDIKFQLDMYGSGQGSAEDTLARVREIVFSPSLTDDQQVVLEWLKRNQQKEKYPTVAIANMLGIDEDDPCFYAVENLSIEEEFQVLAAFAEWGCQSSE